MQAGLVKTFEAMQTRAPKPLILIVPSRTGINIEPSTYAALADHPNIAGIRKRAENSGYS